VVNEDEPADIVIVGSGFGGAVAGCRLAPTGRRVVVLERGQDWSEKKTPQGFRDYFYSSRMPRWLNGWLDLRVLDQMVVATSAGVGGGSLIYANVCVDAPDRVFRSGWPSEITAAGMKRHYDTVAGMLNPQQIPARQINPRMAMLQHAAGRLNIGKHYHPLPLAVTFDDAPVGDTGEEPWSNPGVYKKGTCVHCGNCVIGCEHDAKNTLDKNYLKEAKEHGAKIRPLSMVTHIEEGPGGAWRVHYVDVGASLRGRKHQIVGKIVILAAGSIGSPEILLRSRDGFRTLKNLPRALGKGWSPNGDFLTLAKYKGARRPLEPTKGPTIGAVIDLLEGIDLPDDNAIGVDGRIYVEDGGLPNLAAHLLSSWKDAGGLKRLLYRKASSLTDFSDMIPWFGQSIDAADGEFSLRSPYHFWRARTQLNWNPQRSVGALDTFKDIHVAMTKATGGKPIPLATWSRLRMLVTPHPLGGCNMASAPGAGVTNHMGEVFGYDNLFVMDGSVIPRAIGRNPSKTIAAVAERSCEKLVEELPRRLA
jgi:cholesterol oxidase